MASTTANEAPAVTPSRPGSPSGLRVWPCISAPAMPSASAGQQAEHVRGTRSSRTITASRWSGVRRAGHARRRRARSTGCRRRCSRAPPARRAPAAGPGRAVAGHGSWRARATPGDDKLGKAHLTYVPGRSGIVAVTATSPLRLRRGRPRSRRGSRARRARSAAGTGRRPSPAAASRNFSKFHCDVAGLALGVGRLRSAAA